MQEVIDKEIEDMLAMGIIERSEAPYASPFIIIIIKSIYIAQVRKGHKCASIGTSEETWWQLSGMCKFQGFE